MNAGHSGAARVPRDPKRAAPHLVHVFSTFVPAGPQVRTAKLLAAFGREYRHTVIAMDGRTGARELLAPGLEVAFADPPPKAGTVATALRMRARLAELAPDLLLTYNFGAVDSLFAARMLDLGAVVHHEDGFLPDEAAGFKSRRIWVRRAALQPPFEVVVISRNLERIARELWRVDESRLHFIPNGIEVERFPKRDGNPELRDELGIPRGAFVVGAVGHLRPEKNLPRLLRAVAAIADRHDVHVLLLGDGPEREKLDELAAAPPLRGRVHFAGYHADPRAHYRAMDAFALTSDTEQMPIALLEAMACSLPVVATDVGDVRAVLPQVQLAHVHSLGPDVEPALARSLASLVESPLLRADLGRANRGRVASDFGFGTMVRAYRELYESALPSR